MGVSNPPAPLRVLVVSDTADIVLNDIAASYNNFGAPFALTVPANGVIEAFLSARLRNDVGGGGVVAYLGLRIGGINYWFSGAVAINGGAGPNAIRQYALQAGGTLNDYIEPAGEGTAGASTQGAWRLSMSVAASGIPTGAQDVQLVVARSTQAASLRGTTTPSRCHLSILKA